MICGEPAFAQTAHHAIASLLVLYDGGMQRREGQSVDEQLSRLSLDGAGKEDNSRHYLERAKVWVGKLLAYRSRDPESHRWAFEVYRREEGGGAGALLRAAKALYQSRVLGGDGALTDPDATRGFVVSLGNSKDPVLVACGRSLTETPPSAGSRSPAHSSASPSVHVAIGATPNLDRCTSSSPAS